VVHGPGRWLAPASWPSSCPTAPRWRGCAIGWRECPALRGLLPRCGVVDAEFAGTEAVLRESSDVAPIPPVSGD
jgi:hypothetical protein